VEGGMTEARNRIEASYTSISWIPSEAIGGLAWVPFDLGIGHYDEPPPDSSTTSSVA
jgi:hypothetical protein